MLHPWPSTAEFWFGGAGFAVGSVGLDVKAKTAVEIVIGGYDKRARFRELERDAALVLSFFGVIRNKNGRVTFDFRLAGGRAEVCQGFAIGFVGVNQIHLDL